ncbi:GDYXXLXY domain-containing protein [Aliiglaciecola litoralis]|uniref:GDYXXLXY domain-containing protein n=1 Tax=Aliiglaciecola litoralis TaxID=582857 RepID=A0ABP3WMU3_9ALTE
MLSKVTVVVTGIVIVVLINFSIWQKQNHLTKGEEIVLELAPVDPRSIMQGDYMRLDYQLSRKIRSQLSGKPSSNIDNQISQILSDTALDAHDGYVIVALDENQVAKFVRLDDGQPLLETQRKLQYRVRGSVVKFATNAYFFEEGLEPVFRDARYGAFKLNKDGEVLLTHLLDENMTMLGE